MTRSRLMRISFVILVLAFIAGAAQAQIGAVVSNWAAPSSSSVSSSGLHHSQALADVTFGLALIGVTPCRIVDTRGPAGPFGGPSLPASTPRSFTLPAGPCAGIPATAAAYSLNITVTNTLGAGFISLYPTGGAAPLVSTLNYVAGQTLANAAIVPSGTSAAVTAVAGVSGTDLIIDINGYYVGKGSVSPLNPQEYVGFQANLDFGGALFGWNTNTAGTNVAISGVWGYIDTPANGPAGVYAVQNHTSGVNYGVDASNNSVTSGSSAVFGQGGTAGWTQQTAGMGAVRGIADGNSIFNQGVIGEGTQVGVAGFRVNSAGALQTYGYIGYAGTDGIYTPNHLTAVGGKSFAEPHATDPTKVIKYVCPEGPEHGTYFRGRSRFVGRVAIIDVPEHFRTVTDEEGITVQVTPIGEMATVAVTRIGLDRIEVRSNRDVEFSYMVNGVRKAYKDFEPVQNSTDNPYFIPRSADQKMESFWPAEIQGRLINSGIYNSDGTPNMATAERVGWAQKWREAEARQRELENRQLSHDPFNRTPSGKD